MRKRFLKIFVLIASFIVLCLTDMLFAACNISTTTVTFVSYDVFSTVPLDTTGTITVDCNESPPPSVTIAIGSSPNSGGFNPRKMILSGGGDLLEYNFYTDNNRTKIWGDGRGNTYTMTNRVRKNRPWVSTV
ncbi:MAG: spore coat U domain-containing protein [Thermodesulfovibrionia bacterium]|nr:spore coat U domain-containing protein [Thermodesulfovibrionia bacterium]